MTSPWEDEAPAAAANDPSVTQEAPGIFSFSAKTGTGYEAGLINFRGSLEELAEYLGVGLGPDKQEALANVTKAWNKFHHFAQKDYAGNGLSSAAPKQGGFVKADSGRPGNADDAPAGAPPRPSCRHGQKKYVTKVGSKGRWHAWGCPGGKDDQCSREENSLEFFKI